MAASFSCGVLAIPKDREPNWDAAEKQLQKLSEDEVKNLVHNGEDGTRDLLLKVLTEIREAWNGEAALYSRFDIHNLVLLITGDRTWGDSVEEINYMVLFEESGMAEAAGFLLD